MFKVVILWGEAPDEDAEPETYEFSTGAESAAFLKGVQEAIGWGEYEFNPAWCARCKKWGEHWCDPEEDEDGED